MVVGAIAIAIAVPVIAIVVVAAMQPSSTKAAPSGRSVASGVGTTSTSRVTTGSMVWAGQSRRWRTFVPAITDPTKRLPLLVLLHPAGGTYDSFLTQTGMDSYAEDYHFVTVAPQGAVDGTWDAGGCCGVARDQGADDIGFINALLDRMVATADVDPGQIYVAGASNGGMLGYALACRLADRIQAVFSAGGAQTLQDCHPSHPVSVIEFHSLLDGMVPSDGGVNPKFAQPLTNFLSTTAVFAAWSGRDNCQFENHADAGPGEQLTVWYGCNDNTLLEVWLRTSGGGHEWPKHPDAPVDASTTISKVIASGSLLRHLGHPSVNPLIAHS